MYIYVYMQIISMTLVIILYLDPRHYFAWTCDHIINVFPVHSLNKRFLTLILMDIHEIFRIWTQEAICYTVSRLSRLFHALQTRRGGGLCSRSASCICFVAIRLSFFTLDYLHQHQNVFY